MQACRVGLLDSLADARRVLCVGEGDGRFVAALLQRAPAATITVVEASGAMIDLARARIAEARPADVARVHFVHGSIASVDLPRGHFDAVATCYFLDCLEGGELAAVVERLGGAAAPRAKWLQVDFQRPQRGHSRLVASAWLAVLYAFFGLSAGLRASRLEDPAPRLARLGFRRRRRLVRRGGMLSGEVWERGAPAD